MEVISLEGLKKIASGEKLPKNYKSLIIRYLEHKSRFLNEDNSLQFFEAVKLAKRVGITWKIKK